MLGPLILVLALSQTEVSALEELAAKTETTMHALAISKERGLQFTVCDGEFDREPQWSNPDAVLPPLSTTSAIRKARHALASYVDDASEWRLVRVTAKHIRDQRWTYVVSFFLHGETLEIPVLFSGRVVKGETYKALLARECP